MWDRVEQAATSSAPPPSLPITANRRAQPRPKASSSSVPSSAFPSLSAASSTGVPGSAQYIRATAAAQRTTPWTTSGQSQVSSAASTPALQPFSVAAPSSSTRAAGAPTTSSMAQFPSLQPSSAARAPPPREFVGGNQSVKKIRGDAPAPTRSVWGPGTTSNSEELVSPDDAATAGAVASAKKKKKGKEKLFTLGSYAGPA